MPVQTIEQTMVVVVDRFGIPRYTFAELDHEKNANVVIPGSTVNLEFEIDDETLHKAELDASQLHELNERIAALETELEQLKKSRDK